MQQRTRVHRHENLRLRRIGEHIACIFLRDAELRELVVRLADVRNQRVKLRLCLGIFGNRRRRDVLKAVCGDIALRLLVVARDAMAHELVRQHARDTLDAERERDVLDRRGMAELDHFLHHRADFLVAELFRELFRADGGITEARRHGNDALGFWRVIQKFHLDGQNDFSFMLAISLGFPASSLSK